MNRIDIAEIANWYDNNYEDRLQGRRVTLDKLKPFLDGLGTFVGLKKIGESFEKRDIFSLNFGSGKTKILLWTQMHGNESTGTKALFDLINFFKMPGKFQSLVDEILSSCEITCIPILNPDGAEAYTRINAQKIDLNRDVINKEAGESVILQIILKEVNPEYCFNLHDQRTIFSVGVDNKPATMSFLAPSVDAERSITQGRIQTMQVIASINSLLQQFIPGRVGRYTDEFYPTATGDNFQKMGHNTILIESGHSKGDYARKISRKTTFFALIEGIRFISSQNDSIDHKTYFEIPNNEKKYLDVVVKGIQLNGERIDVGVLYKEKLGSEDIFFIPTIEKMGNLIDFNTDREVDGSHLIFSDKSEVENWVGNEFN